MDVNALTTWFLRHQRVLPWREEITPYRVWISEIMLQQTQVSVVSKYFNKWMQKFPSIRSLAQASIEEVIKTWEGLGYYSRARHLHEAACDLVEKYDGQLPHTKKELLKIKGIGPYTAGAILVFAYGQREVAIDANVQRVLARYLALSDPIKQKHIQRQIESFARQILPQRQTRLVVEGLIELGALVCKKIPDCKNCPLVSGCQAKAKGIEYSLPMRKKRPKIQDLYRQVGIIRCQGHVLARCEKKGKVMADLWHFPYLEKDERMHMRWVEDLVGEPVELVGDLPLIQHSFTRYRAFLYPQVWAMHGKRVAVTDYSWIEESQLKCLPFCGGHRKIVMDFLNE